MDFYKQPKESLRIELARLKVEQAFLQFLTLSTSQSLLEKLIDDSRNFNSQGVHPSPIFTDRLSASFSQSLSLGRRSSLTPPLPPVSNDRTSDPLRPTIIMETQHLLRTSISIAGNQSLLSIPQFYFPKGRPIDNEVQVSNQSVFNSLFVKDSMKVNDFEAICSKLCGIPKFLAGKLMSLAGGEESISKASFWKFWKSQFEAIGIVERFFMTVKKPNAKYIDRNDFKPIMKVLMDTHPGLDFLKATPEFQDRYADTVIERIFYIVDKNDDGKITLRELKRSNLVDTCLTLDEEEDINKIRDYFSYEHFYVLYCRFWEIDTDHDFIIDKEDFSRYEGHTLSRKANDRIFEQAARRFSCQLPGKMAYEDFIWFMISEEDKTSSRSLEYWFKLVDLDSNGIITSHEMEYFYEEQLRRLEYLNQEAVPFKDILCQMSDMLHPEVEFQFTLEHFLMKKSISGVFFNALLNLNKFIAYEQRDPFSIKKEINENPDFSEWDRFALMEYVRLAMEEENADNNEVLEDEWDN
jgi:serine/threonine-protein phosphatase 2A regulatory subunit B''